MDPTSRDPSSPVDRADDDKEAAKEDLENITLEELKARYLRYRKRTDEWKEKMKAIALKERSQLTMTTNQLRQNTKVLRETTERLEAREKDYTQLEKDKKDLERQVQELNKTVRMLNAQANNKPEVNREKIVEEMTEEITHKMDIEFRSKKLQVETQYKQIIAEMKRDHTEALEKLQKELATASQQKDHLQAKYDALLAKTQTQNDMQKQALQQIQSSTLAEARLEGEREYTSRLRDMEQRVVVLEKEKARILQEYEQYKVRSQTAFKKSKSDERELQQQRQLNQRLQQQLQSLKEQYGAANDTNSEAQSLITACEDLSTSKSPAVGSPLDGATWDTVPEDVQQLASRNASLQQTVEDLRGRLHNMETICLEADQKLNEVTDRLQADSQAHREEVQRLQEEMTVLRGQASRAEEHFQKELRAMDEQLGREITRLQGAVKSKAAMVDLLCERMGIDQAQLQDGLVDLLEFPHSCSRSISSKSPPPMLDWPNNAQFLTPEPVQSQESLSPADLDFSATNVGQTAFDFDFQALVSLPAADPHVSAHHLNEYKESQLKRLAADLEASQEEVKGLQEEIKGLQRQLQRHQDVERMLRDDIRKLQMTTYTEETWVEKRNYIKNIVLKFIQSRHNEEVQAQLVPVISMVLAFTPIELQMVQRSFKR